LKIGIHLPKLLSSIKWLTFFETPCISLVLSCLQSSLLGGLITSWMILLHSSLSSIVMFSVIRLVRDVMFSIHSIFGRPSVHLPGSMSSTMSFSRLLYCHTVCLK